MMQPVWAIVFCDLPPMPPDAPWRNRVLARLLGLLRPGFRHAMAMRPIGDGDDWLVVNPHSGGLDAFLVSAADLDAWMPAQIGGWAVARSQRLSLWLPRGPMTCVAAVKHILGVGGFALTPHQLYRHLAKGDPEMGGAFSSPKAPDTSAQDTARAKTEEENAKLKAQNEAQLRNRRSRTSGRSLLAFTDESGVQAPLKDKLGG